MKNLILVFLLTLLVSFSFITSVQAGCIVTVKGRYDRAIPDPDDPDEDVEINVSLIGSDVKTKMGWWSSMSGQCDWNERAYSPGENFSVRCELDLGCNNDRRYRFLLYTTEEGRDVVIDSVEDYYPGSATYTRNTTIDLGDMSRHFR